MLKLKHITGALTAMFLATQVHAGEIVIALSGKEDPEKNGEYVFIKAFSEHVAANGMTTVVHPSNTLGKEGERFDQTAQGLIHINMANPGVLFKLAPVTKGIYLPFMFDGIEQFDSAMGSGVIDAITGKTALHGVRLAGFAMRGGQVGLFNTKVDVANMSDVAPLRLRGKDGVQIKMFESWGAKGTIVSWGEVANALQTGVADGYYNPPASALLFGHTDILKHYTPLNAGPSARMILASEDWYQDLNDSDRAIIDAGIAAGIAANREWTTNWSAASMSMLTGAGVTVTELADGERAKFVAASKAVWGESATDEDLATLQAALGN